MGYIYRVLVLILLHFFTLNRPDLCDSQEFPWEFSGQYRHLSQANGASGTSVMNSCIKNTMCLNLKKEEIWSKKCKYIFWK